MKLTRLLGLITSTLLVLACAHNTPLSPSVSLQERRQLHIQKLVSRYSCDTHVAASLNPWLQRFFHEASLSSQLESGRRVMNDALYRQQLILANHFLSERAFVGNSINLSQLVIAPFANFERDLKVLCVTHQLQDLYQVDVLVIPQSLNSEVSVKRLIVESVKDRYGLVPAPGIKRRNDLELLGSIFEVDIVHESFEEAASNQVSPRETD